MYATRIKGPMAVRPAIAALPMARIKGPNRNQANPIIKKPITADIPFNIKFIILQIK